MNTRSKQAGMSALGILAILIMVGFFAMCIIRMAPHYFEFVNVRDIIERIVMDPETQNNSFGGIRRDIATNLNTNQIYGLKPREVEIYRKEGKTYIDASYEVRLPIMWRIDAVLNFNDLKYEVGNPTPILSSVTPAKKP